MAKPLHVLIVEDVEDVRPFETEDLLAHLMP